ncbi:PREDICTED: sodium/potassium-transporting ATPase subunit alpha-2-like [Rhagoletis zephyria]|uniref:sodium/potassium-transporting ATPase subunit alpha-2-like n=1 Tax=Rhagoletis zephyria TaxID=28612 RepID=UPI0008115C5C|nr:PREDICTED: sodium/potassium-transporting ATPase subunit alpha-2-like [Rhagoletis zephyria]
MSANKIKFANLENEAEEDPSAEPPETTAASGGDKKEDRIDEHLLNILEVCVKHTVDRRAGLTSVEVAARLARDGPNCFTPPRETPWYVLFLREMTTGFALLLWFAGLASFVSFAFDRNPQDAYLGLILVFTVVLTGSFSYYQTASSSKVFRSFKNMTPQSAYVLRNGGRKVQVPAEELVVGDIVFCQAGDRIPADIRVIVSDSMKVDNSSITGESEPLLRTIEPLASGSALEASNLAFFSTNCTDGSGVGVVIATGDRTVMGDIASLVSNIAHGQTPIAREISHFVKIITLISVVSGVAFAGIYLLLGTSFFKAFLFMIGITVGNVPEGLLPALTVALTLTAKRMAAKRCLVKHLEAVETLGSTSTICTDKTGTLTQNRMTVEHLWFGGETYVFREGAMRHDVYSREQVEGRATWQALKRCAMLCSRAEFLDEVEEEEEKEEKKEKVEIEERPTAGDASETAILKFLERASGDRVSEYRSRHPKVAEKPFSSSLKYAYSVHQRWHPQSGLFEGHFLVLKGAPERVLALCGSRLADASSSSSGETVPLDDLFLAQFEETYRQYGSEGERVLAFADLELDPDQFGADFRFISATLEQTVRLEGTLRFLGLVSMMDPPRPSVPQAVRTCREAGIRVVMVTGDHPITAQAIAKAVNIISAPHRQTTILSLTSTVSTSEAVDKEGGSGGEGNKSIVIPGDELASMSPDSLEETLLLYSEIVFARTTPQQKLQIVETFQRLGEVVAVTGDGVNDSPALKKADIGIAMGISGSEVSKQAADMILLDDNFATIVVGIEEGRRIFDNMKKTVSYILGGNCTTIYPFVVYGVTGVPLAISTITALLISLGTDIVPAVSLSYEPAEGDIMAIKPRDAKRDRLVDKRLLVRAYAYIGVMASVAAYGGYFVTMYLHGYTPAMLWQSRKQWEDVGGDFPRIVGHEKESGAAIYEATVSGESGESGVWKCV